MIVKLLCFLFKKVIGDLPEEQKREFWARFTSLMSDVASAATEGAVRGAVNK